jgi:hypothetical protein
VVDAGAHVARQAAGHIVHEATGEFTDLDGGFLGTAVPLKDPSAGCTLLWTSVSGLLGSSGIES